MVRTSYYVAAWLATFILIVSAATECSDSGFEGSCAIGEDTNSLLQSKATYTSVVPSDVNESIDLDLAIRAVQKDSVVGKYSTKKMEAFMKGAIDYGCCSNSVAIGIGDEANCASESGFNRHKNGFGLSDICCRQHDIDMEDCCRDPENGRHLYDPVRDCCPIQDPGVCYGNADTDLSNCASRGSVKYLCRNWRRWDCLYWVPLIAAAFATRPNAGYEMCAPANYNEQTSGGSPGWCTPWGSDGGDLCKNPGGGVGPRNSNTCKKVDQNDGYLNDCDESCAQDLCNKENNCKGYTLKVSTGRFKLKSHLTGIDTTTTWGVYRCYKRE